MSLTDLDSYYIKSVGSLHSYEHLLNREPSVIQTNLEEAIKSKTGIVKDFTSLIASVISHRPVEEIRPPIIASIDETKTASSSDNELELDLFNEDLMCVICNGMDVGARNRLLECLDCHSLYHQECHRPPVTTFDFDGSWICQTCKDAAKRPKKIIANPPIHITPSVNPIKHSLINSPPYIQRPGTSSTSNHYKSTTKSVAPVAKASSNKTSGKSTSSSTAKNLVTPNINIISADKRLQIMKKKAAKLHEKRKQLPR